MIHSGASTTKESDHLARQANPLMDSNVKVRTALIFTRFATVAGV